MDVSRVTNASTELVDALERLLPQLAPGRETPSLAQLEEMLAATGTRLLVARDHAGTVVGMLMLLVYRTPSGLPPVVMSPPTTSRSTGPICCIARITLSKRSWTSTRYAIFT